MKNSSLFAGLSTEPLSPHREKYLVARLAQSPQCQMSLALESMWEAVLFLRSCACAEVSTEELFCLAWDALTRAVKNFKPRPNFRFFIYAKCYLRGNLKRTLKQRATVRYSTGQIPLDTLQDDSEILKDETPLEKLSVNFDFSNLDRGDNIELLAPLLRRLPREDLSLIKWRYADQLPDTAIATRLGVTRQAANFAVRRVLKKLRWMVRLENIRRGDV